MNASSFRTAPGGRTLEGISAAVAVGAALLAAGYWASAPTIHLSLSDATRSTSADDRYGQRIDFGSPGPKRVLFVHPPGRVSWSLQLPPGRQSFEADVGLDPRTAGRSDGVSFAVWAQVDGVRRRIAEAAVGSDPKSIWPRIRGTFESTGREVVLSLESGPGTANNFDFDWALWSDPRIVSGDRRVVVSALLSAASLALLVLLRTRRDARPRVPKSLGRALLAAASAAATILAVESVLRAGSSRLPATILEGAQGAGLDVYPDADAQRVFDRDLGFRYRPNRCWTYEPPRGLVESDELPEAFPRSSPSRITNCSDRNGFLNPAADAERPIAAIGDSFTAGVGFPREKAWPGLLASSLGIPVSNYGMLDYGPDQYSTVLERYVLPTAPRAVVVGLFEGNDLDDESLFVEFRASGVAWNRFAAGRKLLSQESRPIPKYRRTLIGTSLWSASSFVRRQLALDLSSVGPVDGRGFNPVVGEVAGHTLELGVYAILTSRAARPESEVRELPGFRPALATLTGMYERCRTQGIPMLVVLFPSSESIYPWVLSKAIDPSMFARFVSGGDPKAGPELWSGYLAHRRDTDRVLLEALGEARVPVVSLFEPIEQAAQQGELLYLADDSHLNEQGNAFVADHIRVELQRILGDR